MTIPITVFVSINPSAPTICDSLEEQKEYACGRSANCYTAKLYRNTTAIPLGTDGPNIHI